MTDKFIIKSWLSCIATIIGISIASEMILVSYKLPAYFENNLYKTECIQFNKTALTVKLPDTIRSDIISHPDGSSITYNIELHNEFNKKFDCYINMCNSVPLYTDVATGEYRRCKTIIYDELVPIHQIMYNYGKLCHEPVHLTNNLGKNIYETFERIKYVALRALFVLIGLPIICLGFLLLIVYVVETLDLKKNN